MQRVVVFLVALAAILLLSGLFGQNTRAQADPSRAEAIQLDVSAVRVENGATADHVYINRNDDGTIESIHGGSWGSGQSLAVDMALDFVRKHYIALGLTAPNVEMLRVERENKANGMTVLTLRQYVQGAPVLNGYLDVSFGASGQMIGLNNRLVGCVTPSAGVRTASEALVQKAVASSRSLLYKVKNAKGRPVLASGASKVAVKSVTAGYWATSDGLRSVHAVVVGLASGGFTVRSIVDDDTLDVYESALLTHLVDGSGSVFEPNPMNYLPLLSEGSLTPLSADSAFTARMTTRTLRDLSVDDKGGYHLAGTFATVGTVEGFTPPTPNSPTGFVYNRSDPNFAAVNAYYWVDATARSLSSLGFGGVNAYSVQILVHSPSPDDFDNAYFQPNDDGSTGYFVFGDITGMTASVAEDGDVVAHETGHEIQSSQAALRYRGQGQAGAQGEGFSDFWAAVQTYQLSLAHRYDPAVVGEWANQLGLGSRRVDADVRYPGDMSDDIHVSGMIWSSALWSVFLKLPDSQKSDFVKIVLQSHYLVPDKPKFRQGGHALVDANKALLPAVVDARELIRTSLKAHGIFTNAAPINFSVAVTDTGNVITWKNASDVAGSIQIMRGKANDPPTNYQSFSPSETTYTDTAVDPRGSYTYYLTAVDIDDPTNVSKTEAITVVASENVPSQLPLWYQPKTELAQQHASGGGGGGCFIATAAYGTATEPHVMTLRAFRDNVLLPTAPGRWFVATYYRYSPPVADWIREREWARSVVRLGLAPMILTIEHPVMVMVLMALALFAVVRLVRRRRMATALA